MKKRSVKMITIILFMTFFIGFLLYVVLVRVPIKKAIRIEDVSKYPDSILVKEAWHTGTGWEQVGDTTDIIKVSYLMM